MIVTTVATSLYHYFSSFVPSLASDCKKVQKLVMLSRNRFCLLDRQILNKLPDHLFGLNYFDSILHTIVFQASLQSFLILVAEVPQKNSPFSAVLFFSAS